MRQKGGRPDSVRRQRKATAALEGKGNVRLSLVRLAPARALALGVGSVGLLLVAGASSATPAGAGACDPGSRAGRTAMQRGNPRA
jgi:hypothetical protein